MRGKLSVGVVMALALLIPAAPAAAQAEPTGLNAACQTVERKVYKDIRELVTIDLETATDTEVRVLANQILAAVKDEPFPVLPPALQAGLDGTEEELRAFLEKNLQTAWKTDLRINVGRTMTDAGPNVDKAAQETLDSTNIDTYLAYLNDGLYAARELDCAAQPSPSPSSSVKPSASASVAPSPSTTAGQPAPGAPSSSPAAPGATPADPGTGGEGGGLPVTGAATGTVAAIGGALLLLGGAGFLIGRRRRSRFVA